MQVIRACFNSACDWRRVAVPLVSSLATAESMHRTSHRGVRGRQTHIRPLLMLDIRGNHAMRCSVLCATSRLFVCMCHTLTIPLVIRRFFRVSHSDYLIHVDYIHRRADNKDTSQYLALRRLRRRQSLPRK